MSAALSGSGGLPAAFDDAARLIDGARRCVVLTHQRADGDAIGSVGALQLVLRDRGLNVTGVLFDALTDRYAFTRQLATLGTFDQTTPGLLAAADLWILVDTAATAQVVPLQPLLADRKPRLLVLDHHRTGDIQGDVNVIDPTAPSATQLLERFFRHAGWTIPAPAARLLLMGLATDTGWFRFSNADSSAFECAARLIAAGASSSELYDGLYQVDPPARFALFADVCSNVSLLADGRLAVMQVSQAQFARHGATPEMTEDLVNEPFRMAGVQASVLLVESADGVIRVNLRGRGAINVAAVAQQFGGGGHTSAAGARIADTLDSARQKMVAAMMTAVPVS